MYGVISVYQPQGDFMNSLTLSLATASHGARIERSQESKFWAIFGGSDS